MASVHSLFRAPKKRLPMEELQEAQVMNDFGFEGCVHARPGRARQVLLVDKETLDAMDLQPGIIRENITTTGLNVNSLAIGQQLRVGRTLLEVSEICAPWIAQRAMGKARDAVPGCRRRDDPSRRHD
jgi:MOSC domain-containing protein YiiM